MASEESIESLVLRKHAETFVQCSDCTPILGVLRANNVINEVEYQRIKAKQTSIEKNGCVKLTILINIYSNLIVIIITVCS